MKDRPIYETLKEQHLEIASYAARAGEAEALGASLWIVGALELILREEVHTPEGMRDTLLIQAGKAEDILREMRAWDAANPCPCDKCAARAEKRRTADV